MLIMALLSLVCGVLAGRFAAKASSGLACNLRESIYEKVQTFAFSNIDKFSTAGLVTRMTTDVTNVQNAAQMLLRVAVRAPLMLVCSMVSPSVQGIARLRLRPAPCRSSRNKAKAPVRTAGEGAFSQDSASFTYLDGVSGKRQMSLCLLRRFPVHLFFRLRRERFPPHADQPADPAGAKNDWFLEREVPLSGNQPFLCFLKFCHTRCVGEKAPASPVKNLRVSRPPAPVKEQRLWTRRRYCRRCPGSFRLLTSHPANCFPPFLFWSEW